MTKAFETLVRETQTKLHQLFLKKADKNSNSAAMKQSAKIPWSWVARHVAETLLGYPTGLTDAVLIAMLELQWEKDFLKKYKGFGSDFGTVYAVYDSKLPEAFLLEVSANEWQLIPSSCIFKLAVSDGGRQMDLLMHPKFSPWIESPFFQDRKLRMICPPKANSPVYSEDHRLSVALIPPTELIIIMLDRKDSTFVSSRFGKLRDTSNLWSKIIHTEKTSEGSDIYLSDMSSDALPVVFSLSKSQEGLSSLFRRNDYLGLFQPEIVQGPPQSANPSGTVLYYTSQTVIFLMPEVEAKAANLAKANLSSYVSSQDSSLNSHKEIVERDEEGFMDCSTYESRIFINDLTYCMLNVTLFGKVVGLAKNNPFLPKNGKKMNRYALKIADTTGTMDITLWEESGYSSRELRVGQYILLNQLVTSDRQHDKKIWYVNGSAVCGTKLYNISTITSVLTTTSFRHPIPLWYAKESKLDHFQVEATIVGWELHSQINQKKVIYTDKSQEISILPSQHITSLAHVACLLPLLSTDEECEFCGCLIENELTHVFRPKPDAGDEKEGWIEWILDDGTSTCHAFGGEESLLNITAHRYSQLLQANQIDLLNSLIGVSIISSVTDTECSCYRLEQTIFVEPTLNECYELLKQASK
ncbi:hypothetical protein BY458DRAFT_545184 [Sporodiniella umbellata]|nr:hypothetical protein BY458DRAFT_545184 [Sporodiniella umbellata]